MFQNFAGTKLESQQQFSDDDFFGSYTSENLHDMSNDASIFSDIDIMTDDFFMDGLGKFPSKKKKANSASTINKKEEEKTAKGSNGAINVPTVVIAQKLELPSFLDIESFVKEIVPSLDGSKIVIIAEVFDQEDNGAKPLAPCGAILVYDITVVENLVLLSRTFIMLKKIEDSGELPTSCCLIPPESGASSSNFFACPLRNGGVLIYNMADLSVVHQILAPADGVKITSVAYCSRMFLLYRKKGIGIILAKKIEIKQSFCSA